MKTDGPLYNNYANKRAEPPYDQAMRQCVERTVTKLLEKEASTAHPGMLLGKIQSGKTRTFLGVMALAFENGYDVAIVLTKNSTPLAAQTLSRIESDLCVDGEVLAFDIMQVPRLEAADLLAKLIIVSKKEDDNINRLTTLFKDASPSLSQKRVLIIDDEADYGSVGFRKVNGEYVSLTIPDQLDTFRNIVRRTSFLQVTATPNALYLQPEDAVELQGKVYKPMRPSFTSIVPVGEAYVGTDYFFDELHRPEHPSHHAVKEVSDAELSALKKRDERSLPLPKVLTHRNCESLRASLLGFIVGATIRRIQQELDGKIPDRYCFLMHTEAAKAAHEWQETVVREILEQLNALTKQDSKIPAELLATAYDDMAVLLGASGIIPPDKDVVVRAALNYIRQGFVSCTKVNSDVEVNNLLDKKHGELRRGNYMNVFIGGQVLDRGLTIKSLIGFYYGRSPKSFQQDTVLQHMRIFGYRPRLDLAVTRLFTGHETRQALVNIHNLDAALREGIEKDPDAPVVFVDYDTSGVVRPCNPSRLIMSSTSSYRPHSRHLPVGFNTANAPVIRPAIMSAEVLLRALNANYRAEEPFLVNLEDAVAVLEILEPTLVKEEDADLFDIKTASDALKMLCDYCENPVHKNKVWLYPLGVGSGGMRDQKRIKKDGGYSDAPDTGSSDTDNLKSHALDAPGLMLVKMKGARKPDPVTGEELGWRDEPFYWPVMITPLKCRTVIFAHKSQRSRT